MKLPLLIALHLAAIYATKFTVDQANAASAVDIDTFLDHVASENSTNTDVAAKALAERLVQNPDILAAATPGKLAAAVGAVSDANLKPFLAALLDAPAVFLGDASKMTAIKALIEKQTAVGKKSFDRYTGINPDLFKDVDFAKAVIANSQLEDSTTKKHDQSLLFRATKEQLENLATAKPDVLKDADFTLEIIKAVLAVFTEDKYFGLIKANMSKALVEVLYAKKEDFKFTDKKYAALVHSSILNVVKNSVDVDNSEFWSAEQLQAYDGSVDLHKKFTKLPAENVKHLIKIIPDHLEAIMAHLKNADQFSAMSTDQFKSLHKAKLLVGLIGKYTGAKKYITDYKNIPAEYFKEEKFVEAIIANLETSAVNDFFANLSSEQFAGVMRFPKLIKTKKFTCAALNKIVSDHSDKVDEYIKNVVEAKHLDIFYGNVSVALKKEVVELLPAGFLNEITVSPHADEAAHYTSKNFKLLTSPKVKLDLIKTPADEIRYLAAEGKYLYKMLTLSNDQKSQLSFGQWNSVFVKVKTCKKFASSANFDFRSTSEIVVDAECFAALPAKNQVDLMLRGRLPADALSRISKDMVEKWEHGDKKGLAVFESMKDKSLLKDFATHADVQGSKHPLKGKSQSEVAEYRTLAANLNAGCLAAMDIEAPSNYEDVRKYGKFIRASEKILEWLEKIDQQHIKDKKESLWTKLTKEQMADLTGPSSILMSQMKKDVFGKLSSSARSGISGEALLPTKT